MTACCATRRVISFIEWLYFGVSTNVHVSDSEKIFCRPCMLIHLCSKTIIQPDWLMCVASLWKALCLNLHTKFSKLAQHQSIHWVRILMKQKPHVARSLIMLSGWMGCHTLSEISITATLANHWHLWANVRRRGQTALSNNMLHQGAGSSFPCQIFTFLCLLVVCIVCMMHHAFELNCVIYYFLAYLIRVAEN